MSGTSPQCVSRIANRVAGWAMRMSAPDMIWNPPPKATPCTAQTTGIGNVRQPQATCCGPLASPCVRVSSDRPEPPPAIDAMSSPAQNARPSPDSTTTRTSGIVASRSIMPAIWSNIAGSSAFILSARFSRTSAMPSSTAKVRRSVIHSLPFRSET